MDTQQEAKKKVHILAVPYPSQGHVNPLLQLCKRVASKRAKTTLAITNYISKTMRPKSDTVTIDMISDGCDDGGFLEAADVADYLLRMEVAGSNSLEKLITKYQETNYPIDCVVYDAFLPWALDVAKKFNIKGAAFFTQSCAVNYVYYYMHHGMVKLPVMKVPVELPGLVPLELQDMPSFVHVHGSYPAYFEMVLNQFSNVDGADFVLVNTFYELERRVVDSMSKICPLLTIGPTLPSIYLDNRVSSDQEYGLNLFHSDPATSMNWLNSRPEASTVYVAFGSMANLDKTQMEEIAWGLKNANYHFLWVVKTSDQENFPQEFAREIGDKAIFVNWSPQLKVLSHKAIGCFFSHGGWNSTIEALSLGVPMVLMPQWTDQPTNTKLVQDVWKTGVRVRVEENGVVGRQEIEDCIKEVMEGEKGKEMKKNAVAWSDLAKKAVSDGGTSDMNINEFISKLEV